MEIRASARSVLYLVAGSLFCSAFAQQPPPTTPPDAAGANTPPTTTIAQTPKPPDLPPVLEDGGYSFEAFYWVVSAQPRLRGGASSDATSFPDLQLAGKARYAPGGMASIPAGKQNTLRLSYFRVQGNGNVVAPNDLELFNTAYSAGDYLVTRSNVQSAKLSWDYLSYTFRQETANIRLKTLYEVQYTTAFSQIDAPLKAISVDSSGNPISNTTSGTKSVVLPTFGMELEQAVNRHFRWEVKGSAFGLPHRSDIWDAEASVAFSVGNWEILAGEKAYHFKTSPKGDEYLSETIDGPYVAIRWYWGRTR